MNATDGVRSEINLGASVQGRMYTNATYRPNIDGSCGRLPDLFERTESGDAVVRADCGSRSLLLGDRAEKGFCHDVGSRCRPIHRASRNRDAHVLALVFVMMAIAKTAADARRVRRGSRPTEFVGRPDEQPLTDFRCYWLDPTAQYFFGEVGLFPGKTPPEDINANNFIRRRSLLCKGSSTNPAAYSCACRYDAGKTFSFKLDKAMAIIVEGDKTNEMAIDTRFMPRYVKQK